VQERNLSITRAGHVRTVGGMRTGNVIITVGRRGSTCRRPRGGKGPKGGGQGPRDDSSVCEKNSNTKPRRALAVHGHFPDASSGVNTQSKHRKASGINALSWCCRRLDHSQVACQRTEDVNVHTADMAMHRLSTPCMQQPLQKRKTGTRFWRAPSLLPGYAIAKGRGQFSANALLGVSQLLLQPQTPTARAASYSYQMSS
jgi:hypothetical protein